MSAFVIFALGLMLLGAALPTGSAHAMSARQHARNITGPDPCGTNGGVKLWSDAGNSGYCGRFTGVGSTQINTIGYPGCSGIFRGCLVIIYRVQ